MALCKLRFFIVLGTIVALAMVGRLDRQMKEFDVPRPNILPHVDASLGHSGQPTKKLWGSHRAKPLRAEIETLPTCLLPVQSKNAKDLAAGKLLVASRDLADPNFAETVVLSAWFIFPEDTSPVFNSDPASLWLQMIKKTELQLAANELAAEDPWMSAVQFSVLSLKQ
jgi:hypothetical protein